MKVLLDEDLPHLLRRHLGEHDVRTVAYMGWNGLKNGQLLSRMEEAGFEVLITGDKNFIYQQNLNGRRVGVVCLSAQEWRVLQIHLSRIIDALSMATPGSFQMVVCG